MAQADVFERLKSIIVDKLDVENSEVTKEASFSEDLGANSLDQVELIMAIEDEFVIQMADDEAEKIKTVGQAFDLIIKKNAQS
ncbi:acyl carrier protein [Pseudomonas sp. Pseusp122]|uniref:acyl carrier protein n=1 Tax=unclassified Pseudomonas TaxID=196821 RepID=UPI0039A7524C